MRRPFPAWVGSQPLKKHLAWKHQTSVVVHERLVSRQYGCDDVGKERAIPAAVINGKEARGAQRTHCIVQCAPRELVSNATRRSHARGGPRSSGCSLRARRSGRASERAGGTVSHSSGRGRRGDRYGDASRGRDRVAAAENTFLWRRTCSPVLPPTHHERRAVSSRRLGAEDQPGWYPASAAGLPPREPWREFDDALLASDDIKGSRQHAADSAPRCAYALLVNQTCG
jgi:hypothetical protein